jgi:hypothetical protein
MRKLRRMTGSLEDGASPFDGLHERQISALLDVLNDSELGGREHIRRRYLDREPRFETTLRFLTEIGALQEKNGVLGLGPPLQRLQVPVTPQDLAPLLINLIVCTQNRFRSHLLEYVGQFRIAEGSAVHRPSTQDRSAASGVRNLLMELGAVSYDASEDQYVLAPQYSALMAQARCAPCALSPAQLHRSQQDKEDLGLSAEIAVVSYERQRVGARLADRIDHVALRNVAAGYDIQSVSVVDGEKILPRYIEVKAVSVRTFQFYWTPNEVSVAELFGAWYYLYLLPVDRRGTFSLDELRVICDPHRAVLGSPGEWTVETAVMKCILVPRVE